MRPTPRQLTAIIPVALEYPDSMLAALKDVLAGEYETGHFGSGLTILDMGANVGAFTLWAHARWPQSSIYAYEPEPETFRMLERNVAHLPNVQCVEAAVYPSESGRELLWSRHGGDVEAGLVSSAEQMFAQISPDHVREVPVVHPRDLPYADIVKLDVEGSEAAILGMMDLGGASLVLLEFHDDAGSAYIKRLLARDYVLEKEARYSWDWSLKNPVYHRRMAGNHFGHLFFVRRGQQRLQKIPRTVRTFRERLHKRWRALLRLLP